MKNIILITSLLFLFQFCDSQSKTKNKNIEKKEEISTIVKKEIIVAAEQPEKYLLLLKNKRVAIVANQSSLVKNIHLLDFLLSKNVKVVKVFAPEHGFRGNIDRGEHFNNTKDKKTGIPIVAIFGKNRMPDKKYFSDVDVVIFDIQDVGVRFFTYISSMHNVMEQCAETKTDFIVFDRPNPLGDYVAGPVLQKKYKSFVGMHPIPIVHGLTIGELAKMINGEGWLKSKNKCKLTVIKVKNYKHSDIWNLKVKPSPNLPNRISIRLYPSLCFFEASSVSIGRGTQFPFQVIGYPDKNFGKFTFTPHDIKGMQVNPLHESEICHGDDLRNENLNHKFTLKYFIDYAKKFKDFNKFVTRKNWFNLLAGNSTLLEKIKKGMTAEEIEKSWQKELLEYKKIRQKYLLYK